MESLAQYIEDLKVVSRQNMCRDTYLKAISLIDLTSLSPCDTEASARHFAERAVALTIDHPEVEGVASICVYPPFVESVGLVIDGTSMRITSVAGGFPSSQTFLEVKALEVAMAIESGADEVDIVMPVGKVLEGLYDDAESEIVLLREEAGDATLKVILETGELESADKIYEASMIAIRGGADFIKTSTGKTSVGATPEAVVVMCRAIKEHFEQSGERVGIKVAGGVKSLEDVAMYYTIVERELGDEWLCADLFRIGASSLLDTLLDAVSV